jgi:hypothetical protein
MMGQNSFELFFVWGMNQRASELTSINPVVS